jgi:hypothetical protein
VTKLIPEIIDRNVAYDAGRKSGSGSKTSIYRKVLLRNDETPFIYRNSRVIGANSLPVIK